jgi:broad specificity phosphatase PhoE
MYINLERHAESMQNAKLVDWKNIGDYLVPLTARGRLQAIAAGESLDRDFLLDAINYGSPYLRTRLTFLWNLVGAGLADEKDLAVLPDFVDLAMTANEEGLAARTMLNTDPKFALRAERLKALKLLSHGAGIAGALVRDLSKRAGLSFYEDLRLREIDHGTGDMIEQQLNRQIHSYLLYRLEGGESPGDGFDRMSTFLESMMRQVHRKNKKKVMIVSHGLTIRCFAMRFMHLSVEQFNELRTPGNCNIITIGPKSKIVNPQYTSGRHAIIGLTRREEEAA